jgi:RHS repeat-associated protein
MATTTGAAAQANPFRYIGGIQDVDSSGNGTVYALGDRYYDAQGHFSQPDALAGTISDPKTLTSYNYAGGDPINYSDPSGYFLKEVTQAVSSALTIKDGSEFVSALRKGDPGEAFAIVSGTVVGSAATYGCSLALGRSGIGLAACAVGGYVASEKASDAVRDYNYGRRDMTP